ncbi:thioesterase II family protein [Streptomyces tsukubensis]|uniref:thioesterase II family protein n=1 Tax=Streptomyces tsukubensis TaxID=83656 RepID=UPI0036AD6767
MNEPGTSAEDRDRSALLCLPFAGAGPSFFHPWRALSAGRRRVVPAELPGRERRILEPPYRNVVEAAVKTVDDIAAELGEGTPTVVFGHSLGAVLAYELVPLLADRGVPVELLVVSGSPGPWTQRERRATGLPDEEFLARVEEFAGFRHEALDHPEMRELILPVLQADCEMHENYVPSTGAPVPVPICSVRGDSDGLVTAEEARQWRHATTDTFRYAEFPGDHMFLVDHGRPLLDLIETESGRGR